MPWLPGASRTDRIAPVTSNSSGAPTPTTTPATANIRGAPTTGVTTPIA